LSNEFERKKEDAINRIIRNERIKEIRIKMHEYELLKEYQSFNATSTTNSAQNTQQSDSSKTSLEEKGESNETPTNDATATNIIDDFTNSNSFPSYYRNVSNTFSQQQQQQQHSNKYNNKTLRSIKHHQHEDEWSGSKLSAYNLEATNAQVPPPPFDEYKHSQDESVDAGNDDDESNDQDADESNEDSNESGIEDDVNFFTPKRSNQATSHHHHHHHHHQKTTNRNANSEESLLSSIFSKNSSLFVKPGFEMYQIGGGIFNLNSSQSTFQLKCSIISAEVKNIVNILKQVLAIF